MYTFTNKLRNFSIILMVVGFLGLVYGFLSSPDTVAEAQAMVADAHHGEGHGAEHGAAPHDTTNPPLLMERSTVKITMESICCTNYKTNLGRPSM
jgi:hypothetical protein